MHNHFLISLANPKEIHKLIRKKGKEKKISKKRRRISDCGYGWISISINLKRQNIRRCE